MVEPASQKRDDGAVLLTINIENNDARPTPFAVYQAPSIFEGSSPQQAVYTTCLFRRTLPTALDGGQLTFRAHVQHRAGVQVVATAVPPPGGPSSPPVVSRRIRLAAPGNFAAGACTMVVDDGRQLLDCRDPVDARDVPEGFFRIVVGPSDGPARLFNVGSAIDIDGRTVLSTFVRAVEGTIVDCRPLRIYHVAAGRDAAGPAIRSGTAFGSTATCDFSGPHVQANVTYQADGRWDVAMI